MGRYLVVPNADYSAIAVEKVTPIDPSVLVVITTLVNPVGAGSVTGGGSYDKDSEVVLNALPSTEYRFKQWSDGSEDNPHKVIASSNATYTAIFEKIVKIDITTLPRFIGSLGTTNWYGNGKHSNVLVSVGEKYTIHNSHETNGLFVGVTKDIVEDETTKIINYSASEQFKSRIRIAPGEDLSITIPDDGKALVLSVVDGGGSEIPGYYIKQ